MSRVFLISGIVVLLDQATKATVLEVMYREQSIPILGDWLRFTFTENPGMAFGITIGPPGTVTILALIATGLVGAYIYQVRHDYAPYRWSLAFILGGALGNIIDRVFYGVLLDYGSLFTGRVVDFIHVSLWQGFIPRAVPFLGGSYLELFPVWNVADMSIVLGVVGVMLFHQTFHMRRHARRVQQRAATRPRALRHREAPGAVFSDLTQDLGAPPAVPPVLSSSKPRRGRPTPSAHSRPDTAAARSSAPEDR